ncbi:hypothetical protein [Polaromonas sp. LjRoot131]|uniref:hypothetical protein n=1 Tax=Polaromonas sp. LjRoot131 TaxID=3342262 RepID=UPI003ECDD24D
MDHNFLKGNDRERPFAPPPEKPILRWLSALLTLLALTYAGYRLIEWLTYRPPAAAIKQTTVSNPPMEHPSARPPQSSAPSVLDPGTKTVTKCVINGNTSYGDGSCGAGGVTTQVPTKANHNLMVAVRPQAPAQAEEPISQPVAEMKDQPTSAASVVKARCEALEAKIASLDAMGRQPQTLQTYDWIRDERKKARDEQFRVPCK